jgi:hypothetical protein
VSISQLQLKSEKFDDDDDDNNNNNKTIFLQRNFDVLVIAIWVQFYAIL